MQKPSLRWWRRFFLYAVMPILAAVLLMPTTAQQQGVSSSNHPLFELRSPGLKAPLVGFFYSAEEKDSFSISQGEKTTPIPFDKIKRMRLTPGVGRFSRVTVERTDGTTIRGEFASFTLLFIDPQKDQPIKMPLSDPNDSLADFGNREMVNCAVGTFTRKK